MDEVWKREEVESPCVKLCIIHPDSGFCMGCYRTGLEISEWSNISQIVYTLKMNDLPS